MGEVVILPSTSRDIRLKAQYIANILCAFILVLFTGLVLYSVMMRYFFSHPPMWGEDLPKLLFIWLSFLGAGFAYLMGANIRMTVLIEMVPALPRRIIEFTMHLLIVGMLVVIIWYSLPVLKLASGSVSISTGLPEILSYLPLPIAAVLLLINEFIKLYRIARGSVDDFTSSAEEHV